MADLEVGNPHGVQNVSGTNRSGVLDNDNLDTIATMKARLAAVDEDYYTEARLNNMTMNDMVYAIRVADENGVR